MTRSSAGSRPASSRAPLRPEFVQLKPGSPPAAFVAEDELSVGPLSQPSTKLKG